MQYVADEDAYAYVEAGALKLAFALFPSTLLGTLPVSLYLADRVSITGAQAALAVMLSMSLVGSQAKLEVFSENTRQMKRTTEQRCSKKGMDLSGRESAMRKSIIIRGCNLLLESL